jgi:hypothetical protein
MGMWRGLARDVEVDEKLTKELDDPSQLPGGVGYEYDVQYSIYSVCSWREFVGNK